MRMAPTEFHETLGTLGLAQQRVAALFGVGPRSVRRWQFGERRVPCGVGIVFRLLADGVVTVEQVERAANPIPVRVNGGTEPFAPLPFEIQSHYAVDAAVDRAPAPVPEVTAP